MKTLPATLIIHGPSATEQHTIVAFSMCDPSTNHIRFRTREGRMLTSHGCVFEVKGDINALPSAFADLHTFKITARMTGMDDFVDWYEAKNEVEARKEWIAEAEEEGFPIKRAEISVEKQQPSTNS